MGCPARDEADRLALEMLEHLLDPAKWEIELSKSEILSAEMIALAMEKKSALICVGSLPPGRLAHTRYLCKWLRAQLPDVKILVGRWGLKGNLEQNQAQLLEAGADMVATTLLETRKSFDAWLPVLSQPKSPAHPNGLVMKAKKKV